MPEDHSLDVTFHMLAADSGPAARHCLRKALEENAPEVQRRAFETLLRLRRRWAQNAIVAAYHLLPRAVQTEAVRRFEDLLPALRPLLNHTSACMRRNAIEILADACRTRLTYLYVHALNDSDDHVASTARDALTMVTSDYHLEASAARRGAIQIARDELASHKYSILDPLSTALKTPGQKNLDALVAAAVGLDPSLDAMLMRLLAEPGDRRARALLELLWNDASSRIVSFVVDLIVTPRLARIGLRIAARRCDAAFVRALLDNPKLNETDATAALEHLHLPEWTDPRHGVVAALSTRQALAALRLITLADVPPDEKTPRFEALAANCDPIVTAMVRQVQNMLGGGVTPREAADEIVRYTQVHAPAEPVDHLGSVPMPLPGGGGTEPADPVNARILSQVRRQRVNFRDFMDNFERLNPTLRKRAAAMLAERDPNFPLKVLAELGSEQAGRRMQGLKTVELLDLVIDYRDQIKSMLSDLDDRIRATAARLGGRLKDTEATRSLLRMVMDHDHRVCAHALESLADAGTPGMNELLRLLSQHSDNRIRANAIVALHRCAGANVTGLLRDMLGHEGAAMRISALWAAGEIGNAEELKAELAEMGRHDPDADVRDRARKTLQALKANRKPVLGHPLA